MPMVTRPSADSAVVRASRMTDWKAAASWINWSAAADSALYAAKGKGRDGYAFFEG